MADVLPFIASIAALITAVASMIIAWRKSTPEIRGLGADTASKYQQIADRAAEKALKLQERIGDLENRLYCVEEENKKLREENVELRSWAERLVHQVKSLGAEPVKLRTNE